MMGANGLFGGSVAMLTDITKRKQAEEALRQSSEFNQAVLKSLLVEIAELQARRDFPLSDSQDRRGQVGYQPRE
jgi:PAS domain-containing protein